MAEYLAPGVYVEETSFRQSTIEGVSTSVAGIVGPAAYGPIRGRPLLVTSIAEFESTFGPPTDLKFGGADAAPNYTALAARAFFDNGGKQLYVARIAHDIAGTGDPAQRAGVASAGGSGPVVFEARFPGSGGNVDVVLRPVRRGSRLSMQRSTADTDVVLLRLANVTKAELVSPAAGLQDAQFPLKRVVALAQHKAATGAAGTPEEYVFVAGQKLSFVDATGAAHTGAATDLAAGVVADDASRAAARKAVFTAPDGSTGAAPLYAVAAGPVLAALTGLPAGKTTYYATGDVANATLTFPKELYPSLGGADLTVPAALAAADVPIGADSAGAAYHETYDVFVQRGRAVLFSAESVALAPDAANSFAQALAENPIRSSLRTGQPVAVRYNAGASAASVWGALDAGFVAGERNPADPAALPRLVIRLAGGTDGAAPSVADYAGEMDDQAGSYGLAALEDIEQVSIVICPAAAADSSTHAAVVVEMLKHSRKLRYRMAVIEAAPGSSLADVQEFRARFSDSLLALYYPWVKAIAANGTDEIVLPPSGFIAGIYADTDVRRGVHKAPANEVIQGATGLELYVNKFQQEVLNPLAINCLRFFPNRGLRVWGSRTLADDPEWKYVNVRRYFLFLEHSIENATSWVVFEPNGERLWANVRATVYDFLYNEWVNGHLLGSKPESAFFVRCDRSTMTQNDLDNGRLVCLVGVAPLRPAEFVIFRVGQKTADS